MDEKINIQNIIQQLIEKYEIEVADADAFVKAVFDLIKEGLEIDGIVKIKGLGTFKLINVERRESIDVNTGERISIESHTKISFVPDLQMRDLINKPFSHFETVLLNEGVVFDDMPATFPDAVVEEQLAEESEIVSELPVVNEPEVLSSVQATVSLQNGDEIAETIEEDAEQEVSELNSVVPLLDSVEEIVEQEVFETGQNQSELELQRSGEGIEEGRPSLAESVLGTEESHQSEGVKEMTSLDNLRMKDTVNRPRVMTFVGVGVAVMLISIIVGVMYYFYQQNHSVLRLDNMASGVWVDSMGQSVFTEDSGVPVVKKDMDRVLVDGIVSLDTTRTIITGVRKGCESVVPDSTSYRIVGTMTTYQIKRGETLTMVSRRFYETKDLWPYLVMHNRNVITNPDNVPSGTLIRIPALRDK